MASNRIGFSSDFNLLNGNLGVGTTNPTSKLSVVGNVLVSGIVTATTFVGNLTGTASYATTAGVSTSVIGGIGSVTQLQVTGISTFTNGPVLIGAATSTGTASQRLQVTGGAYVSGNLGIGIIDPQSQLHITGQFQSTNSDVSTTFGTGQIYLNGTGTYGNRIDFNQVGAAPPSIASRSVGTKILLYPNDPDADYAIGIDGGVLWNSVPSSLRDFKWYAGETSIATLFGTGELVLGTTQTITGTALQPLQVNGDAYISSSVGIGTINPTSKLHVVGDTLISGIITANSFSGNASSATYATTAGIATSVLINPGIGIATAGGTIGIGITLLDFRGPGISTVTVSSGIGIINITSGGGSSTPDISPVIMGMIF